MPGPEHSPRSKGSAAVATEKPLTDAIRISEACGRREQHPKRSPNQKELHCSWLTALGFATRTAQTSDSVKPLKIAVRVSPQPLNTGLAGLIVTVHTGLQRADVRSISVFLNGRPIGAWTYDTGRELVAKFLLDEARHGGRLLANASNTLTVLGIQSNSRSFWGEAGVTVVEADTAFAD